MSEFVDHIRSSILEDATIHTPYTYHGDGPTRIENLSETAGARAATADGRGGHPCTTTVKATWPICIALHTTSESRMFSLKLFVKTIKKYIRPAHRGAESVPRGPATRTCSEAPLPIYACFATPQACGTVDAPVCYSLSCRRGVGRCCGCALTRQPGTTIAGVVEPPTRPASGTCATYSYTT